LLRSYPLLSYVRTSQLKVLHRYDSMDPRTPALILRDDYSLTLASVLNIPRRWYTMRARQRLAKVQDGNRSRGGSTQH
jgi:hypothetical protein